MLSRDKELLEYLMSNISTEDRRKLMANRPIEYLERCLSNSPIIDKNALVSSILHYVKKEMMDLIQSADDEAINEPVASIPIKLSDDESLDLQLLEVFIAMSPRCEKELKKVFPRWDNRSWDHSTGLTKLDLKKMEVSPDFPFQVLDWIIENTTAYWFNKEPYCLTEAVELLSECHPGTAERIAEAFHAQQVTQKSTESPL